MSVANGDAFESVSLCEDFSCFCLSLHPRHHHQEEKLIKYLTSLQPPIESKTAHAVNANQFGLAVLDLNSLSRRRQILMVSISIRNERSGSTFYQLSSDLISSFFTHNHRRNTFFTPPAFVLLISVLVKGKIRPGLTERCQSLL